MDFWTWFWRYDYSSPDCPNTGGAWVTCTWNGTWFIELLLIAIIGILIILEFGLTPKENKR